jgi:hypothetical protein
MDFRKRGHLFRAVLSASTAVALIASLDKASAQPASSVVAYNIPAQPLTAALTAVAQRSGLRLAYSADLSAGHSAPALQGSFTPAQAIGRLLAGSGLTYRFTSPNAVTIERQGRSLARSRSTPSTCKDGPPAIPAPPRDRVPTPPRR